MTENHTNRPDEASASPAPQKSPLEIRYLRLQSFDATVTIALKLLSISMGIVVAIVIVAMARHALRDDAFVIASFHAPDELSKQGLDGDVLAAHFVDQLAKLDADARTSQRTAVVGTGSDKFQLERENAKIADMRVEIPHTGVSISELQKFFDDWLGKQRHITGEAYNTPAGPYVTVRIAEGPSFPHAAPQLTRGILPNEVIEGIFSDVQPAVYAEYLIDHNRLTESVSVLKDLTHSKREAERAFAWWELADIQLNPSVSPKHLNVEESLETIKLALQERPNFALTLDDLAWVQSMRGHDEESLNALVEAMSALRSQRGTISPGALEAKLVADQTSTDEYLGDYRDAIGEDSKRERLADYQDELKTLPFTEAEHFALLHNRASALAILNGDGTRSEREIAAITMPDGDEAIPMVMAAIEVDDWKGAADDLQYLCDNAPKQPGTISAWVPILYLPWLAYAKAHDPKQAKEAAELISKTPIDCYICARMRGQIDAVRGDWQGAHTWAAKAASQAPALPFAYLDDAKAYMGMGKADLALSSAKEAAARGPHFADAIEYEGEILLREGRYQEAVDKLEEANQIAPRWGHLHLILGHAFARLYRRTQSIAEFRAAEEMDLSPDDRNDAHTGVSLH